MKVHDEVYGMQIDPDTAAATVEFRGTTYHFCSRPCARRFEECPEWYVPLGSSRDESG